jgi:hypothetical protein
MPGLNEPLSPKWLVLPISAVVLLILGIVVASLANGTSNKQPSSTSGATTTPIAPPPPKHRPRAPEGPRQEPGYLDVRYLKRIGLIDSFRPVRPHKNKDFKVRHEYEVTVVMQYAYRIRQAFVQFGRLRGLFYRVHVFGPVPASYASNLQTQIVLGSGRDFRDPPK